LLVKQGIEAQVKYPGLLFHPKRQNVDENKLILILHNENLIQ
jgi:hypothetical protein